LAGDNIAYEAAGANFGDPTSVYLRLPTGERRKVSAFAGSTTLEAVNRVGDVAMVSGGRRYLAKNGEFPVDIGGPLGQVRAFDAGWYLLVDALVFRYDLSAEDGGTPSGTDAATDSSLDAGVDVSTVDAPSTDAGTGGDAGTIGMIDGGDEAAAVVDALGSDAGTGGMTDAVVSNDGAYADAVGPNADTSTPGGSGEGGAEMEGGGAPNPSGGSSDNGGCSIVPRSSSRSFGWMFLVGIGTGVARRQKKRDSFGGE
jgi:hypothetical protein